MRVRHPVNYWLDLFTGTTWDEFRKAGATVSGYRERMRSRAKRVKRGDVFLCYLTGVMRWVGMLEVIGPSKDRRRIWQGDEFPVRFDVRPVVMVDAEYGVPMEELLGRVSFFAGPKDRGKFKGFVRMSPNRFMHSEDAALIVELLKTAQQRPPSEFDQKKYDRKPRYRALRRKGKVTIRTTVSVPEDTGPEAESGTPETVAATTTRHTEIQYHLLKLGTELGLDVWVARNDRSKVWNGESFASLPGMLTELPAQFNEATTRTIELIDVLWLRKNSIAAAFEVECTTAVYSGLLRMSDLLALQPDLDIKLYLVAPDDRRGRVEQEITRPTFALRDKPLPEVCGFLSFTNLMEKVDGIRKLGLAKALKPDFLEQTAEYFTGGDEEAEG